MKPIIKWPGGKTQCLSYIRDRLPKKYNTYYEPFLGGAAVLLELNPTTAAVNDINPELINMYSQVRDNIEDVIKYLASLDWTHEHSGEDPKEVYYAIRGLFNIHLGDETIEQAARFIYLNKHCFNGLYRVNKKGEFNVPFNGRLAGASCDPDHLRKVSKQLQNVKFKWGDFEKCVADAKEGDLIYFDPPYDYETGEGFVDYSKDGWTRKDLIKLKYVCDQLVDRGCYVLVSNNSTTFIQELFNNDRYSIEEVSARRAINRKGNGRGPVPEVIIRSKNCISNIC